MVNFAKTRPIVPKAEPEMSEPSAMILKTRTALQTTLAICSKAQPVLLGEISSRLEPEDRRLEVCVHWDFGWHLLAETKRLVTGKPSHEPLIVEETQSFIRKNIAGLSGLMGMITEFVALEPGTSTQLVEMPTLSGLACD